MEHRTIEISEALFQLRIEANAGIVEYYGDDKIDAEVADEYIKIQCHLSELNNTLYIEIFNEGRTITTEDIAHALEEKAFPDGYITIVLESGESIGAHVVYIDSIRRRTL